MFIARTRLVQIATGASPDTAVLLQTPAVLATSGLGVMVETVPAAMALVPVQTRPAEAVWWQYVCEWLIAAELLPTVRGVIPYALGAPTRTLIVDVDVWLTAAARLAGDPPAARNTFSFVYAGGKARDFGAHVQEIVFSWLRDASFAGWAGDRRDPALAARASTAPADDPANILQNARLRQLDGAALTVSQWRR